MAGNQPSPGKEGAVALPEDQRNQVQTPRLDGKLKFPTMNEPIRSAEYCHPKETMPVDPIDIVAPKNHDDDVGGPPQTIVAEYTKPKLVCLIADLEEMVQALEGTRTNTAASLPQ